MRKSMKKACFGVAGFAVVMGLAFCHTQSVVADCGKMLVVTYRWVTPPPPPPLPPQNLWVDSECEKPTPSYPTNLPGANQSQYSRNEMGNITANPSSYNNIVIQQPGANSTSVKGFDPTETGSGLVGNDEITDDGSGSVWGPDSTFAENRQQGVIAWNGKEEVLILTTNEKSLTGSSNAMVSVLPLPGPPKDIKRASANAFAVAKGLIAKKVPKGSSAGFGVYMERKIGAHNIFVWEMDNIETFRKDVQSYVAKKYNNNAAALITPETERVIKRYFEKGYRYFAFDLTIVEKEGATKEAIAYHFESQSAYFPLVISQIGGKGHTMVDLVVLTPGHVKLGTKAVAEEDLTVVGNKTFDFSVQELQAIDKSVADLFKGYDSVRGGNFIFDGTIDKFSDDFKLIKAN